MNVLIIEDTIINRLMFEQRIREMGHTVWAYAHAEAALEVYREHAHPLILVDLGLPGMDGFEFCRRVRAMPSGDCCMILVLTAFDRPEDIEQAIEAGADDYQVKPVSKNMLTLRVRVLEGRYQRLLQQKQAEREVHNLRTAVETMPLGLTITDLHGTIIYTNQAEAEMHGYAVADLLGQDVRTLAPPELRNPLRLEDLKAWKGLTRESVNITSDGRRFPVHLISEVVKGADGEPYAVVTSCEDITERKAAEQELMDSRTQLRNLSVHLQAVREEERTTIAREIHDDLGQALTALKIDLAWLKQHVRDTPEARLKKYAAMTDMVEATLQGMKRITTELRPGLLDD